MKLTTIEMTAEEKAALQPVGDRLNRLVADSTTNLVHDAVDNPVPDSLIGKAKNANLSDAYDQARQRLDSAEDHIRTVLALLTGTKPLPTFSLFTLVRGAAIPTVHARYLVDPRIDESTRLGRGLSARLENLVQQQKVHPEQQGNFFVKRVDHLRKRAEVNGVKVVRDRNDRIIGFGERWPSDTELFDTYMPGGAGKTYFQYLSGYAHSLPWAQLPMHRAQPSDDPGVKIVPTDMNVPVFAAVLDSALGLYDETIRFVLACAGYPPIVWNEAKRGF